MEERASSGASPEKVITDNIPFSGSTLNNLPHYVEVPPASLPSYPPIWPSGHSAANESAREASADQTAVSERYSYQQYSPNTYPDTGSIKFRRENSDFVPHVSVNYPLLEVGTGRVKNEYCGTVRAQAGSTIGACKNNPGKHKPLVIPNSCKRRTCPECWPHWARKAGKRVSVVLNGYLNAKYRDQRKLLPDFDIPYLPDHVSVHPGRGVISRLVRETELQLLDKDPSHIDPDAFHKLFNKKYRIEVDAILEFMGVSGYIEITHDIRLKSDKESSKADQALDANRYREVLNCEDWRARVKFSPHSHIITDGCFIPLNSDELYERTGWTYRNHRPISGVTGLVYYLLSHAPARDGLHNIRYCGTLNKHRLSVIGEITIPVFPYCPECIAEGIPEKETGYVISKVEDITYKRDELGRKVLDEWSFSMISNKPVRKTEHITVYRILAPGEKRGEISRDPKGNPDYIPLESWEQLPPDKRHQFRWKKYYTLDEWAVLPAAAKPGEWV